MLEDGPEFSRQIDNNCPWLVDYELSEVDEGIVNQNCFLIADKCSQVIEANDATSILRNHLFQYDFQIGSRLSVPLNQGHNIKGVGEELSVYSDGSIFMSNARAVTLVIGYDSEIGSILDVDILRDSDRETEKVERTMHNQSESNPACDVIYVDVVFHYVDGESDQAQATYYIKEDTAEHPDEVDTPTFDSYSISGQLNFAPDGTPIDLETRQSSRALANVLLSVSNCTDVLSDL